MKKKAKILLSIEINSHRLNMPLSRAVLDVAAMRAREVALRYLEEEGFEVLGIKYKIRKVLEEQSENENDS